MQQNSNRLYISFGGNAVHRYILNESIFEQIEDSTIEDELISTLPDDGTAMYWFNIMNKVVCAMKELLYFRAEIYRFLKENSEFDDLDKWFEKCIFADTDSEHLNLRNIMKISSS